MAAARFRAAVSPLRRKFDAPDRPRPLVAEAVAGERPSVPLHCLRPAVIEESAARFVAAFPGDVLYAVKCNPEPAVLRAIHAGGVRHFDCASPGEVGLVRAMFPDAAIHYMHPVKARPAIREAYRQHNVRDFSLDCVDELDKIVAETRVGGAAAKDLGLFVRLALPKGGALYDLSGKFGAVPDEAAELLRRARGHAQRLGVCFHVGSQCMEPASYARALALAGEVIRASGVTVDVIDVGGGLPVSYPEITPPPLELFMAAIAEGFAKLDLPNTRLWAEPGRALVAGGMSVVVQVQQRRGDTLYINDGIYGSLSDAGVPGFRFPAKLLRQAPENEAIVGFEFFGPTCDSADRMRGPFLLPADVREGDWIEVGQLGAYGACLRTAFNGFDKARIVEVADPPMLATP
jgi:ornithine decarboxylase